MEIVLSELLYHSDQKRIPGFKCHEFIEIKEYVEKVSR